MRSNYAPMNTCLPALWSLAVRKRIGERVQGMSTISPVTAHHCAIQPGGSTGAVWLVDMMSLLGDAAKEGLLLLLCVLQA